MAFIDIDGVTIPIADQAPSSGWQRTYSGPGALTRGTMRKSHRNHRRSWRMRTHPLPYRLARTIAEWVVGNQHVGLFYEGLELSTGLNPLPDYADVRLVDLGLDERGGGMKLLGSTGGRSLGRISYPAQLMNDWTIIWQETTDDGVTWTGAAIRSDGVGYISGVADATAGAAGTTLQVSVRDGVAHLESYVSPSPAADVGVHQLVIAPYLVDVSWLATMTADGFNQMAPSPIHETRGDFLPDRFRYAVGRKVSYEFVPRPDDAGAWDQAAQEVSFELVEVDEPMRQSEIVSGAISATTTAGGEPALDPPPPPPSEANIVFRVSALEPDGATNRPVDLGSFDMGVFPAATGATYSASAGPNGNPTWAFSGFPGGFTTSKAVSNTNTGVTVAVVLESRTTLGHNFFSISNVGDTTQDHYLARTGGLLSYDVFSFDSVTTLQDGATTTPSGVWYLAVYSGGTASNQNDGSLYRIGETSAFASYSNLGSAILTNSLNGTVYPVIGRLPAFDNDPGGSRVAEVIVWDTKIAQANFGEIVDFMNARWA